MTAAEDEETRRTERARAVALFRYALIREAADPALSTRQRGRLVRELAAREHAGPFGKPVTVSRPSLDRWIRTRSTCRRQRWRICRDAADWLAGAWRQPGRAPG